MKADSKYISYLDGFRGYAILLVILSHFHLAQMDVAYAGVTLFFYVSGLLITKLMVIEHDRHSTIHLKDFYLRRVFRLYPALLFMLVISIAVLILHNYRIIWSDILAGLFYFTNYYLVYFDPHLTDGNYLLVSKILWSLSVEEHFYLFFPLLFIAFYSSKHKRLLYLITALLVVFLIIRIIVSLSAPDGATAFQVTYYTTHCRADSILYGCLSALLLYKYEWKWYIKLLTSHIAVGLSVLALVFSLAYNDMFFQNTIKYSVQGIALAILIPSFSLLYTKGLVRRIVDNPVMVYIGKLSYSLYLFHWVALKIGNLYFSSKDPKWYAVVVTLTIVLSLVSYYFIEKPFVALRRKYGSNVKAGIA
jgi:peptidoglycan/LPS O-acetylase OafA/YrhL